MSGGSRELWRESSGSVGGRVWAYSCDEGRRRRIERASSSERQRVVISGAVIPYNWVTSSRPANVHRPI